MATGCPWDTFHLIICDSSYAVGCHLNMQLYFITKPSKHRKKKAPNPQCEKNKNPLQNQYFVFF